MISKIEEIYSGISVFLSKYYSIIGVAFFTSFLGSFAKRKVKMSRWERVFEFCVKWGVGAGLSILLTSVITDKTMIIVVTSVITLSGEEIASWIANNASSTLTKVLNIILQAFKNKTNND